MKVLDAFCCQGGAGEGYRRAGFDVLGVDIEPQPHNPHPMVVTDALAYIAEHGRQFDLVHASPPCQGYSATQAIRGNDHPRMIADVRAICRRIGVPYVIENVGGARSELRAPFMLCGTMFGLQVYRHRYFECTHNIVVPDHPEHVVPLVKMGRMPGPGEWLDPVGHFAGAEIARRAMDIPWMTREGLREAIPPAYTEFIGRQLSAQFTTP